MKTTKQKYCNLLTLILIFSVSITFAQVGINTTDPADGSILDITSSDKGIFIPRVELTNLTTMAPITGIANNPTDLANAEGLMVYNTSTTTGPGFFVWSGTNWIIVGDNNDDWKRNGNFGTDPVNNFLGTTDTQPLRFSTNGAERVRVDADGVVGIGTTNPSISTYSNVAIDKLNVVGEGTSSGLGFTPMSIFENTGDGAALAIFNTNDGNNDFPALEVGTNNANGTAIRGLNTNGDDTGPAYGVFASTNSFVSGWAGYFNGDLNVTGGYYNISDKRWKKDINALNTDKNILNKVMLLKPKKYKWKAKEFPGMAFSPDKTSYGFIAQELKEVFPDLVVSKGIPDPRQKVELNKSLDTVNGYYMVEYLGLIPILTEAIQEQQEKITSLEKRLESLEKAMGKRN